MSRGNVLGFDGADRGDVTTMPVRDVPRTDQQRRGRQYRWSNRGHRDTARRRHRATPRLRRRRRHRERRDRPHHHADRVERRRSGLQQPGRPAAQLLPRVSVCNTGSTDVPDLVTTWLWDSAARRSHSSGQRQSRPSDLPPARAAASGTRSTSSPPRRRSTRPAGSTSLPRAPGCRRSPHRCHARSTSSTWSARTATPSPPSAARRPWSSDSRTRTRYRKHGDERIRAAGRLAVLRPVHVQGARCHRVVQHRRSVVGLL